MTPEERNEEIRKQRRLNYEGDFEPPYTPERMPPADVRLANAAEYTAFQLGQINRKMDRLIAAFERLAGSQPDPRSFSQIKAEREARQKR